MGVYAGVAYLWFLMVTVKTWWAGSSLIDMSPLLRSESVRTTAGQCDHDAPLHQSLARPLCLRASPPKVDISFRAQTRTDPTVQLSADSGDAVIYSAVFTGNSCSAVSGQQKAAPDQRQKQTCFNSTVPIQCLTLTVLLPCRSCNALWVSQ
ncbi:hypothetical protein JZ751_013892, partial [Albula glossodonta]